MTSGKSSNAGLETPEGILDYFMECENRENNNLIEILGLVKPSKGTSSTLPAIIRGLFTKNSKLLALMDGYKEEISKNGCDDKQQFKNFINEFLIWMGDDFLAILEKYNGQIIGNALEIVTTENLGLFAKPILHCSSYSTVIEASIKVLRNPFIIGKLVSIKDRLRSIMSDFENYQNERNLNDISFENIQLFGDGKGSSRHDKVSSFFSIDNIVTRSKNDPLFIVDNLSKNHCELVLLKLSENTKMNYDSLAILSIPSDSNVRSLIFPPFRLNELAIKLVDRKIVLNSIDFSNVNNAKHMIIIESAVDSIMQYWVKQLSQIFPLEENNSPVSESFLIDSPLRNSGMSGLGINVVTDQEHKKIFLRESEQSPKNKFNIQRDTSNSNSHKQKSISSEVSNIGWNDLVMPINPGFKSRKNSSSSVNSTASLESIKSQYDRSLNIINKTFSDSPNNSFDSDPNTGYMKIVGKSCEVDDIPLKDRPNSSRAEFKNVNSPEDLGISSPKNAIAAAAGNNITNNYLKENIGKFSSVPDLSKPNKETSLYELSSGSAVDVSNFGKNYNPTFSISNNLKSIINDQQNFMELGSKPKKKLFTIFKKPTSKNYKETKVLPDSETDTVDLNSNINSKEIIDVTDIEREKTNHDTQRPITFNSSSSSSPERSDKNGSMLPSPFALPSSTSMYFFKQYKNNSSASIVKDLDTNNVAPIEENLSIPQDLKDLINQESSIDFFITPTSPKSLKISKWKQNHGKWEMLTVNENVYLKLVVNYEVNKGWAIAYKEEFDQYFNEDIDKPIILLDIDDVNTTIRNSSALDLQISAVNSISSQRMQIMIRCINAELATSINDNLSNILGVLSAKSKASISNMDTRSSSFTISSSLMDNNYSKSSSAGTSFSSSLNEIENSTLSKNRYKEKNNNLRILNQPDYTKSILLTSMIIRLQKQLESYNKINIPSSWSILSMFKLSISTISNDFDSYYNFELQPLDKSNDSVINFVINQEDKFSKIEKIGKAGLLIRNNDDDIYMIECKGKKELKAVCNVL